MAYRKLSYATVAKMIGRSTMGLHKAVNNKTLTVQDLQAICVALHIQPQELWGTDTPDLVQDPAQPYGKENQLAKLRTIQRLAAELEKDIKGQV